MPKLVAESPDAEALAAFLTSLGFDHLRVRRRADVLTIESGPVDDAHPHARLRRVTVQYWRLEMPNRAGKWDPTPFRGLRDDVQRLLVESFPWMLQPFE